MDVTMRLCKHKEFMGISFLDLQRELKVLSEGGPQKGKNLICQKAMLPSQWRLQTDGNFLGKPHLSGI